MDNEEIVSNDADQSQFNAAIATLMRIHEIKKWLAVATGTEDLYFYYKHIKMYYKELAPMFKLIKGDDDNKEKKKETIKKYQQRRFDIAKTLNFTTNDAKEKKEMLEFLEEWELELRQIEQDKGMNLPKKPDARWSLTRG